jgi:hypothetical protein
LGNRHIDPSVKADYLDWLLVPPGQRDPLTKKEFCELHGVSHNTLLYWEKSEEFQVKLLQFKRNMAAAHYPDLIGNLIELAHNAPPAVRVQATRLLLDHIDVGKAVAEETEDIPKDAREKITAALREAGYKVVGSE